MFEPGFIPLGFYRELEGIVWDCADCGTVGALVLRYKRFDGYRFRCRSCRRKTLFNGIRADQLAVSLGVPLGRRRAPDIKVWLDEDGNLRESVNGVLVRVIDVGPARAALEKEQQERESAPPGAP
jgi:hypothetical protein